MRVRATAPATIALALVATALAACGGTAGTASPTASGAQTPPGTSGRQPVTVYSGRSETLVKPLLQRLERQLGVPVEVRYGDSSELAAQLLEEGDRTDADLFLSQDAGALGAVAGAGRFQPLDAAVTGRVSPGFADRERRWVATSARARVVAYHPAKALEAARFTTIDAILDPKYRGAVGFAPTNASFHAFVTALRVAKGEDGAKTWLTKFKANAPKAYDKNSAVLDGVDRGEVALGLINHYYWHAKVAEKGAGNVAAKIRFLGSDDPGALVNVAGVGVLKGSAQSADAARLVEALLSKESQSYFADETAEYPVVPGVTSTVHALPALSSLKASTIDLNELDSLKETLAMLNDVGLT